jgi:hypothetical protein
MVVTRRLSSFVLAAVVLTGCADKVIQLRYEPDAKIERVSGAQAVTVFRFVDARGTEGDQGDQRRVGGMYGGYGNRISKVMAASPWPDALVQNLTTGLTQRGVRAVAVPGQIYAPGTPVTTPLILTGEIRNFSTEGRWTFQSHVSGVVRLYNQQGILLLEKPVSAKTNLTDRDSPVPANTIDPLEPLLNVTMQKFIRTVVTDPEITGQLVGAR